MRRLLLLAVALLAFAGAQAQSKGDNAVGLNLVLGTGDLDNVGLGFKYQYNITAPIRIEPTFTYFFKKNYTTAWDLMANFHYVIPLADRFDIYPLAGVGLQSTDVDSPFFDFSSTDFQFNIGCGAEYWFNYNWAGVFEFKYKLSNYDFANFNFGVAYRF